MANEAVPIIYPTKFSQVTVSDADTIEQYTILRISVDPNVAVASDATGSNVFAGILMHEKVAGDGDTNATVALDGEWDIKAANATVTLGADVVLSGANLVRNAVEADLVLGRRMGKALETGSAAEVIRVRVGE